MADSDLQRTSIRVRPDVMDYLDSVADKHGSNRSRAIETVAEEHRALAEAAEDHRTTPEHYLEESREKMQPDDRTFVEKLVSYELPVAVATLISLVWTVLVMGTVLMAGPATTVQAIGAAGFIGLFMFLGTALLTSTTLIWIVTIASVAVMWSLGYVEINGSTEVR